MRTLAILCTSLFVVGCAAHVAADDGDDSSGSDCPMGTVADPATGACVECLTGDTHACPAGDYCRPDNVCAPGCETEADCGLNEGCCNHTCTPTDTLANCGACGNTCDAGDFCDGTQCNAPVYPNFCANKTVYVIHDGINADNNAADLMASTITANCPADVVVQTADQTDPMLVDQLTGQPLAGSGVTYVLGGGPFPDKPLKWLEQTQQVTKLYFDAPDGINFYWRERGQADPVAMMPGAACSPHADQFVTELVTDPMSGTLSLIGYGACSGGKGTLAAAYYYANVLLPDKASYPDSWYVFGWDDTNGNSTPDAGDTFTVLAHGV
jgi:hypothetical protein